MSQFIKLSNRIINTHFIRTVWHNKDKQLYNICFVNMEVKGMFLFGSGNLITDEYYAVYEKTNNSADYDIIDSWYNNVQCVTKTNK